MSAAAVIMARRRRYISAFYYQKALSPDTAKTLAEEGQRESMIFSKMVAQGIFVQVGGSGRYYLDQEVLQQITLRQRKVGMIALPIILLFLALLMMFE